MPLRFALLLALLFGFVVASLTSLDMAGLRLIPGRGSGYDLPLVALPVCAFLAGAAPTFVSGMLRDLGRTSRD